MRMPVATIGIQTEDEWKAFSSQKIKETVWGPGSFAPALCSYSENRPMIDYILLDSAPPWKVVVTRCPQDFFGTARK